MYSEIYYFLMLNSSVENIIVGYVYYFTLFEIESTNMCDSDRYVAYCVFIRLFFSHTSTE